jgi:hypothetical protein
MGAKKGQIDNEEEFLKLYPEEENLHKRDMRNRKIFYEIKNSCAFKTISSDLKIEMWRSITSVKSYKSNLLRGRASVVAYKKAVDRLEKSLMIAQNSNSKNSNTESLPEIINLEKDLLKIPTDLLRILLLSVINKTGIFLTNEVPDKDFNFLSMINLHAELKEKYSKDFQKYSLSERRHIGNALDSLGKVKSAPGNQRAIRNYCEKISKLSLVMVK